MTQETDALIAYVRATGVPAVISDINTPHVHTATSYHYRPGTQSSHVEPLDFDQGKVGLSVDFVFQHGGKPDTPQLAAIYRAFAPVEHLLAELFHSGPTADHFIKNGKSYPIAQLDAEDRAIHHNHVHAAVPKGVLLSGAPQPAPVPAPAPQEDDGMADALVIEYPNGTKTIGTPDGSIFNAGTSFYGSMNDLPASAKQGVTSIRAVTAVDKSNPAAGYVCWSQAGNQYKFDAALWHSLGH